MRRLLVQKLGNFGSSPSFVICKLYNLEKVTGLPFLPQYNLCASFYLQGAIVSLQDYYGNNNIATHLSFSVYRVTDTTPSVLHILTNL